ncbi:hypothetical protein [Lacisediminimonas sp.]|uniref:hypothetical protein n=1 Tax=Lacisediminimonas sp. TaxID=3060582 RepID=UPI002726577F|nr:hypothetical protein [Lacisediminimonas sp.]MDO8299219.1 hypothetical protein [Lacisediminimonas sp.]
MTYLGACLDLDVSQIGLGLDMEEHIVVQALQLLKRERRVKPKHLGTRTIIWAGGDLINAPPREWPKHEAGTNEHEAGTKPTHHDPETPLNRHRNAFAVAVICSAAPATDNGRCW